MSDYFVEHRPVKLPDTCPIDFEVRERLSDVICATVWGDTLDDLCVDCDHDYVKYEDDDDERGVCEVCGATCDWHWSKDIVELENVVGEITDRTPHEWYEPDKPGGFIGDYVKQYYKEDI